MFRKLVVSFVVYLALTTCVVGAGYTDELWNTSEDREYYDCGDWSGVENNPNTNLQRHYYRYDDDVKRNYKRMSTPENFGLPADASLIPVNKICDVAWVSVYINGFHHTLHHKEMIYTDDLANLDYRHDWMACRTFNTPRKWLIGDPSRDVTISEDSLIIDTHFRWHNTYDSYGTHTETISKSLPAYTQWSSPECTIQATLENHSDYIILNLPTPKNITGIILTVTSANDIARYEKHSHCLKTNNTTSGYQYYDLIECDHHTFSGIFPYGANKYLIDNEPNCNISVILFTPFESYNATTNITIIEATTTNEKPHLKNHPIYALAMFLLPVILSIYLYRRFK